MGTYSLLPHAFSGAPKMQLSSLYRPYLPLSNSDNFFFFFSLIFFHISILRSFRTPLGTETFVSPQALNEKKKKEYTAFPHANLLWNSHPSSTPPPQPTPPTMKIIKFRSLGCLLPCFIGCQEIFPLIMFVPPPFRQLIPGSLRLWVPVRLFFLFFFFFVKMLCYCCCGGGLPPPPPLPYQSS